VTKEEMFDVITTNMQTIIEGARGKEITPQHSMRDFGADSLEVVEVVSRTMKQCRRKIKRTDLAQAKSLGDLLDLLEKAPEVGAVAV
jgi:acyl carrier protein